MSTMKQRLNRVLALHIGLLIGCVACLAGTAVAQQSSSSNYQVNEVFFGTGGSNTCLEWAQNAGKTYCAKQSAGELTVGNTRGNAYQAQAGFNTDRTPWIGASIVGSNTVNLGVLNPDETHTGTAQFKVSAYLSHGYVVQIVGPSPTNSGRSLATMNNAASTTGTEQFGMNLRANTLSTATPNTFGADPAQDPDYPPQPFGFGAANHDTGSGQIYDVANQFRYASGDIIARSASSSSYTLYTMSYIANISAITPAGEYRANHSIVATATF